MRFVPTLLVLAALLAPRPVPAEPGAGACHCYRERAFDPERPGAADPYILATARSSLVSAAFGVPKRTLVGAVMSGTAADDLLIAYWAGARAGQDAQALLEERRGRGGWKAALATAVGLGETFRQALAKGASDEELARLAVDDLLTSRAGLEASELSALRAAGAGTNEAILAVMLARRAGATPASMLGPVKGGRASWGRLLAGLGLEPRDVDALVRQGLAR